MKLKLSKKDVVPIIATCMFMGWMGTWAFRFFSGNFSEWQFLFLILLPIPWVILMIFVWISWKKINKDLLSPTFRKTHFEPLYIREGLVRLFQIVIVFIVFIYFILLDIGGLLVEIPVGLLTVINAILAYFGFNTSSMLPEDYVIETLNVDVPSNKKLLQSLPLIKDALNEFEKKVNKTLDLMDKFIDKSIGTAQEIIISVDERLSEAERVFNNIPSYTYSRDAFDKYNYLILLLLLAIINLIAQPAFSIPTYIALPTFSIFGVLIGVSARSKINGNISNKVLDDLQELKENLSDLRRELRSTSDITTEFRERFRNWFIKFKESNFLDFLPSNYSSLISVAFVSFLALIIFIIPFPIPETIFTTMQWFVLYYFTTKQ